MGTAQSPLTNLGYNMVAWPKTGIQPLALLYKTTDGVSSVGANLKDLFATGDAAPPQIAKDDVATDIKGTAELVFDAKGGVNILDWLLNKLNLGKLSANVSLNDNYDVTVSYLNVREDRVNLLELDHFITNSVPSRDKFNSFRARLENNELYVISAIVKSSDISVTISAKNGQDVSLDATVKGILDANLSAARKQSNSIELVYKTDEERPVTFAFKAQQIIYKDASFWRNEPAHFYIKDQSNMRLLDPEDLPTRPLQMGDRLSEL